MPAEDTKTVRVRISGRVQGVWFRDWTARNAASLQLTGWVRNLRDGGVEALFSGPSGAVDDMLRRCDSGPPSSQVDKVEAKRCDNQQLSKGFRIRTSK